MARWKLLQPHYLNIPGTKWEYTENDRATGKPVRREFDVPLYLNPNEPSDWNYKTSPDDGEIIVANKLDSAYPRDYVFVGQPTPDMKPLDEEAEQISASFAAQWNHPIESLPAQGGFSQSLLDNMQGQLADAQAKSTQAQAEGMKEVLASMAAMMKQNQDLISMLASERTPASAGGTAPVARRA